MHDILIRPIRETDNKALAKIVRDTMVEFAVNRPNTVYFDPTTDHLYKLFQIEKAFYNVALLNGEMAGGAGIYPTEGLEDDTCELVKMWLIPAARGIGLGKMLIDICLGQARTTGFRKVYLETMPELTQAMKLYEKSGFEYIKGPMGNSGHTGCAVWMLKRL